MMFPPKVSWSTIAAQSREDNLNGDKKEG